MSTDQLDRALRAADPTFAGDTVPPVARTVHAARALDVPPAAALAAGSGAAARARRRRRVWVATVVVTAVAALLAVGIPLLDSRSAPTAAAAIRLAPFDGLMTPYVVDAVPDGSGPASVFGQQGSTTVAYVPATQTTDGVYVTHTAAPPGRGPSEVPGVLAQRQEADGSWVTVGGYGRFADEATVTALMATTRAAPETSPLQVELAPSGWHLAAFKDLQPGEGVVTVTPDGTLDGPDEISVIRYRSTSADFPAGYTDRGPTAALTSAGRAGILMQGSDSWTLQLRLPAGGSLVLLLPIRMTREQVQRFADGVTVPTA